MPSALIFPFTTLDLALADRLTGVFRPIILYQPLSLSPPLELAPVVEAGGLSLVRPHRDLVSKDQIKALLTEFKRLIEGARDVKEVAFLRSWAEGQSDTVQTPSVLRTAIRRYGEESNAAPLADHLVLLLAGEYDQRRQELRNMVRGLRGFEKRLGRAMGLKAGEADETELDVLEQSADPLAGPERDDDSLLRRRLKAWRVLFEAEPTQTSLWLTAPHVLELLTADFEERTGLKPELVAAAPWDGLGPDEAEELIRRARQGEAAGGREGDLKLWRFAGAGEKDLITGRPGAVGDVGLIGEVDFNG